MELSWLIKLRIAASALTGILLIGIWGWPLAAPDDPFGVVSAPSINSAAMLAGLAIVVGFLAYFISWPHGREIGGLAVPSGLAVWAIRSGDMAVLMQQNPSLAQRQAIFASFRFESIFWLAIVGAGFLGVFLAHIAKLTKKDDSELQKPNENKANIYLNRALAIVSAAVIVQIFIRILARDFSIADNKIGLVAAQPAVGQIAFALIIAFAIAAFVVKKFLQTSYIYPMVACALVSIYSLTFYVKEDNLRHLTQNWPANFFTHPSVAILPVQMTAFGVLGAIMGYWIAVSFEHWRKHEK